MGNEKREQDVSQVDAHPTNAYHVGNRACNADRNWESIQQGLVTAEGPVRPCEPRMRGRRKYEGTMRIERINENKLRVFLSFDDLEDRDIDLETFNYNTPETQELFWDLMEQAEVELGFDAMESQLCVEAVTDVDHGFVITITRMDDEGEFESIQKFIKNRYKRKDLTPRKKATALVSTVSIWSFADFDAMASACRHIAGRHTGSSSAWKSADGYHLVLYGAETPEGGLRRFEDILSEHGDKVGNTGFFEGWLNEYATRLIPADAVAALARLAD